MPQIFACQKLEVEVVVDHIALITIDVLRVIYVVEALIKGQVKGHWQVGNREYQVVHQAKSAEEKAAPVESINIGFASIQLLDDDNITSNI